MKNSVLTASLIALLSNFSHAGEAALLGIPGKVIFESKFDSELPKGWQAAKGKWEIVEGAMRGSEKPEDMHGAVNRMPGKLGDFIAEYEFKFAGAKSTSLSINGPKDHQARIAITPTSVTIQKDDSDHAGPDKPVVFARFAADLQPSQWHKVRIEMVGDAMVGKVDNMVAWGSNDLFKNDHMSPGFTVGGQSVDFRNLKITEATLNPEWSKVKETLPKPGEQMAPPPGNPAARPAKKTADK
jgi:hypothetical protein